MEFADVVRLRRSVRSYDGRPVPRDALERITSAAVVRAPSAGFSQGLRLVVVTDAQKRKAIAVAAAEEELAQQGRPRWKADAPVHIVVLVSEDDYHARYRQPDKLRITGGTEIAWPAPYWYVDSGAAIMMLMLAAIDEGLASAVFGVTDQAALTRALELPDDLRFVAVVTVGYPSDVPFPPKMTSAFRERRKLRDEVVHWERWGASDVRTR